MQKIIAAAIIKNDKVLIAKRNYGSLTGYWEFPGGKVENKETDKECLVREINEELSADIEVGKYLCEQSFVKDNKQFIIVLYKAKLLNDKINLVVHSEIMWVEKKDLCSYNLAPLDRKLLEQWN